MSETTNSYQTWPGTNIIRDPGKFEGEPSYVPDLWEKVLDGGNDETIMDSDTVVSVLWLDDEVRTRVGEDAEGSDAICLWETELGFVMSRLMTKADVNRFAAECADTPMYED